MDECVEVEQVLSAGTFAEVSAVKHKHMEMPEESVVLKVLQKVNFRVLTYKRLSWLEFSCQKYLRRLQSEEEMQRRNRKKEMHRRVERHACLVHVDK